MADQLIRELIIRARDEASRTLATIDKAMGGMEQRVRSLGGLFATGISTAGLALFAKSVMDLGDRLSDLSDKTGLSIEVLGGIRTIAEQSGSSLDAFATGIAKAQKNLGDLDGSGKEAAAALKALGLDVRTMVNLSPDEFLERFAKALATVENRNERAAIAAKVFGKAAADLIPVILNIAENGLPKLSQEAANAYRNLGDLKDQLDALKAKVEDFGATFFVALGKFFGIISAPPIEQLGRLESEFQRLGGTVRAFTTIPVEKLQAMSKPQLQALLDQTRVPEAQANLKRLIEIRDEQEKLLAQLNAPKPAPKSGGYKNLLGAAAPDDSALKSLNSFIDGLKKQAVALDVNIHELEQGSIAAKAYGLELEWAAFKAAMEADKKPIPPDARKRFEEAKEQILAYAKALEIAKYQSDKLDEVTKRMDQDLAEVAAGPADLQKRLDEQFQTLDKKIADLKKDLATELIPEDQQQQVKIRQQYEERIKLIEDWRAANEKAGNDVAEVNQKAAEMVTQAWDVAQRELDKPLLKSIEDAINAVGEALDKTIEGVILGTQGLQEGLSNALRNVFLNVAKTILQEGVVKPLENALQTLIKQLMQSVNMQMGGAGLGGLSVGGPGGMISSFLFSGGFGSRPAGVEGPLMSGGGFFSNPLGWLFSHKGGLIDKAKRFHAGGLAADEIPIIAQSGEFMMRKSAVQNLGITTLERMNRSGKLPVSYGAGAAATGSARQSEARPIVNNLEVKINGDIIPRQPNMSRDDVVEIISKDLRGGGKTRESVLYAVGK